MLGWTGMTNSPRVSLASLDHKVDELDSKVDVVTERLDSKIDAVAERLDSKIDESMA